ncbi:hypothetical protein QZH41_009591 [Actinostola sp. cb2023]|nr:hypothetical protein QZH41_009591 [Actinostola sp. cb2023]
MAIYLLYLCSVTYALGVTELKTDAKETSFFPVENQMFSQTKYRTENVFLTKLICFLLCKLGAAGILWSVLWFLIVKTSPSDDPRISTEERQYIQSALREGGMSSKSGQL